MTDNRKKAPGLRLNEILSAETKDEDVVPNPQSQKQLRSPLGKLPRSKESLEETVPYQTELTPDPLYKGLKFGPPFWTITGILSLIVNVVLIVVLLSLINMIGSLEGVTGNIGSSLLGGLYSNFEKLDRATIRTTIPVDAQVPLNISVPVKTTTQITLAEAVDIPNAQVVINTGGLNINSSARVTLPAGTPLTVNLSFDLPVQTTIPVHVDVPVNIPMSETELHEPFVGLQEVVQPVYCVVDSNATNLDGQLICR